MKIVTTAAMVAAGMIALSYIIAFAASRLGTNPDNNPDRMTGNATNACSCACCRK